MLKSLTTLLIAALALLALRTHAASVDRLVGSVPVKLGIPKGMSDWTELNTPQVKFIRTSMPSTHELIALFGGEDTSSYTAIQVLKSIRDREISIAEFGKLVQQTKQSLTTGKLQATADRFMAKLKDNQPANDLGLTLEDGETITLPVFDEDSMHASWLMIIRYHASVLGEKTTDTVACATTLLWLKRRVVFVYQYAPFTGKTGLESLKKSAIQYVKDEMHLNGIPTEEQMNAFGEVLKKKREQMDKWQKTLVLSDTALALERKSADRTIYRATGSVLNPSPERLEFLVLRLNVYLKDDTLASSTELKLDGRDEAQGKSSTRFSAVPPGKSGPFSAVVDIPPIQEGSHWKFEVVNTSFW